MAGIAVPEVLAISGVDDDLQCNIARISLSSARPNWECIGENALGYLLRVARTKQGHDRREALPLGEIAARTGFSKRSHLNAAFKKRFAPTPMSLRCGKAREEAASYQTDSEAIAPAGGVTP
ncbi:MAG: substrate-binding domain-containing protein [Opitutales bacterium]|nr:substrate-binding domain-containing protein [Opitutales bacterium]